MRRRDLATGLIGHAAGERIIATKKGYYSALGLPDELGGGQFVGMLLIDGVPEELYSRDRPVFVWRDQKWVTDTRTPLERDFDKAVDWELASTWL